MIDFGRASFSGVVVSFGVAVFAGGMVSFDSAEFSGTTVSFDDAHGVVLFGLVPSGGLPPTGLRLPQEWYGPAA